VLGDFDETKKYFKARRVICFKKTVKVCGLIGFCVFEKYLDKMKWSFVVGK
jgi:hypothetical protein